MKEILIAIVLTPLLLFGWVAVQLLWRRSFGGPGHEPDGLAARGGVGSCGAMRPCQCQNESASCDLSKPERE